MRRLAPVVIAVALLSACAARRQTGKSVQVVAVPNRPERIDVPEIKDPNFILSVSESVPNTDDEGVSYTKVFVDGKEAGKISIGRKSEERILKLKLPLGNEPIRLEHWVLPGVGEWTRLDDSLQPRERFVRIEDGTIARLELRFSEGEASNTLTLSREAAPH